MSIFTNAKILSTEYKQLLFTYIEICVQNFVNFASVCLQVIEYGKHTIKPQLLKKYFCFPRINCFFNLKFSAIICELMVRQLSSFGKNLIADYFHSCLMRNGFTVNYCSSYIDEAKNLKTLTLKLLYNITQRQYNYLKWCYFIQITIRCLIGKVVNVICFSVPRWIIRGK